MDFGELAADTLRLVTALTNADLSDRMPQRSKQDQGDGLELDQGDPCGENCGRADEETSTSPTGLLPKEPSVRLDPGADPKNCQPKGLPSVVLGFFTEELYWVRHSQPRTEVGASKGNGKNL